MLPKRGAAYRVPEIRWTYVLVTCYGSDILLLRLDVCSDTLSLCASLMTRYSSCKTASNQEIAGHYQRLIVMF
jgi:hypothetical protein